MIALTDGGGGTGGIGLGVVDESPTRIVLVADCAAAGARRLVALAERAGAGVARGVVAADRVGVGIRTRCAGICADCVVIAQCIALLGAAVCGVPVAEGAAGSTRRGGRETNRRAVRAISMGAVAH